MTERFAQAPVGRAAEVARVMEQLTGTTDIPRRLPRPVELPSRIERLTFEITRGRSRRSADRGAGETGRTIRGAGQLASLKGAGTSACVQRPAHRYYVEELKKRGTPAADQKHGGPLRRPRTGCEDRHPGRPEGPRTFVGDTLPADRTKDLVPIEREGSADEDLREDSAQRIRDYLNSQGYWKADVTVDQRQTGEELEIVFTIRKGPVYRVTAVDISGAAAMPLTEIQPLVPLAEGDVFVASRLDAAVGAIRQHYRTRGSHGSTSRPGDGSRSVREGRVRPSMRSPRAACLDGEVTFAGTQKLDEAALRRVVRSRPGMPWFDATAAGDRMRFCSSI